MGIMTPEFEDSWYDVVEGVFEDEDFDIEDIEDDMWVAPHEEVAYETYIEECAIQLKEVSSWEDEVPCFGHMGELFVPRVKVQAQVAEKYCTKCEYVVPCLFYAVIAKEEYGVWGGTTQAERAELIHAIEDKLGADWAHRWSEKLSSDILVEVKTHAFRNEEVVDHLAGM